ncbi:hypothetical protein CSC13_2757 [Klebsiella pneumoniae]|nr:hypothetical protein KPNJ1_02925 [Klebsiella pneumoniae 30660/NJST258_1]AWF48462.1 hypothetical protein CSC13_2757 [Klebsiella pneumoniae]
MKPSVALSLPPSNPFSARRAMSMRAWTFVIKEILNFYFTRQ